MGFRKEIKDANRIVVKVGTSTLTYANGQINLGRIEKLTRVLSDIVNSGKEVTLVTSGAVGVGIGKLKLKEKPTNIREKQALAAIGQCELMHIYSKFFGEYSHIVGQILLTRDVLEDEHLKENVCNTFELLLKKGVIPIVNENDSVSYTEIESNDRLFGDNDMLSSVVAVLCRASKLVIFSDIDGFYNCDPRLHPDAKLIEEIDKIDDEVYKLAGGAGSRRGTGGMRTKLQAAALATSQGIDTIITNGKNPAALYDIIEGVPVGTKFKAQ